MIFTEAEAKTKWCPMVRASSALAPHVSAWNVQFGETPQQDTRPRCIASACMMWRRADANYSTTPPTERGYCGLAGKGKGE